MSREYWVLRDEPKGAFEITPEFFVNDQVRELLSRESVPFFDLDESDFSRSASQICGGPGHEFYEESIHGPLMAWLYKYPDARFVFISGSDVAIYGLVTGEYPEGD